MVMVYVPAGEFVMGSTDQEVEEALGICNEKWGECEWEWVADWYDEDYYRRSPGANPQGPDSGQNRVVRGGSWINDTNAVRAANRGRDKPEGRHSHVGFRCARSGE